MRNILIILIVFLGVYQLKGQTNITGYQYWFDDDYSNCVNTPITPASQLTIDEALPTLGLSTGIHSFHFRSFDENGLFSSTISSFFYKNLVQATAVNREIVAYEYWFDDDFNGAVTQTVTNQKNLNLITDISTGAISDGIHTFNIRVKDNTGMWSSTISSFFYKNLVQATAINRKIVAYEYWFDDDLNGAVTQTVTNQKNLNLITDISTGAIADGIHTFNIRVKDNTGMWSSIISSFFYKNFVRATAVNRKIIAYRYWVDDSFDKSVTKPLALPVKSLSLITDLDFTEIEKGEHIVHFQFQDNDKMWSVVTSDTINKQSLPIADFGYSLQSGCDTAIASFTDNSTDGDIYLWNFGDGETSDMQSPTHTYYSSGTYTVVLTVTDTVTGQDSSKTEFIDIIISAITSEINPIACDSYTSPSGKYVWNNSGTYTDTVPSYSGCDSVITINLIINESTSSTIIETACDSYESPSGNYIWTSSGNYQDTISNAAGCDSLLTINLTIIESTSSTITETACNSYESPSGNYVWTSSGTYQDTILNAAGCDSVITINLTINESTSSTITETACNSYESPSGNYIWTSSGTYQDTIANAAGCDSVITINLTINESTSSTISATVCDSYDSPSGNYTWTSSGTYIDTLVSSAGCDSVITVNLTVHKSTNSEITVVIEESDFPYIFGTQTLTSAGEYTEIFQSQNGCDSTVTLSLIVGDVIPPRLKCRAINIFLDENGSYELSETDIATISEGSTDNTTAAEDLITTVSPSTFNCENVGDAWLRVYVTDEAGNKSSRGWIRCTVIDSIDLSFVPVGDIEIEVAAGICETKVEYPEISTINPCAQIEFVEGLGPDGMFPLGTTTETWRAINTSGDTTEVSFDVTVTTVNSLPTLLQLTDTLIDEDSDPVTLPLRGISYGKDCMEQGITVSAVTNNSALLTNIEVNYTEGDSVGSLEFTIAPNFSGSAEVTVTVEDREGAIVSDTFVITVSPVNDPPFVVTSVANQMVYASYELKISVSSILGELFDDIDDTTLTIVVAKEDGAALPAWATIINDSLICTPMIADTGSYTFVVTATDAAGASSSTKFTLIVKDYPTAIDYIESGIFEVSMFPNPTKGEVTLKINSSSINDSEVIVRSITGSEVFRKSYKATNLIKLDLSEQVSGVYLVTLKHGNNSVIKKLILDKR